LNFQYIIAHYNDKGSITLYASDENRVIHELEIVGFEPYFYVREEENIPSDEHIVNVETGFKHKEGFSLAKITVTDPLVVSNLRSEFREHFEADIKFIRRFLIDTRIYGGFTILSSNLNRPIHYSELIPTKFYLKPTIMYFDVEVFAKTRFPDPRKANQPLIAWTAWNNEDKEYLTVLLDDYEEIEKITDSHTCIHVTDEKTVLKLLISYLEDVKPFVVVGWNVDFDINYATFRGYKYGIKIPFKKFDKLDLCLAYRQLHKRLYNRLKDVAVEEGIFSSNELISDEYHAEMWEDKRQRPKLVQYNKMDVEILVKLDHDGWFDKIEEKEKPPYELTEFFWNLKNHAGVESCRSALWHGVLVDTLALREAYRRYVLNSSRVGEGEPYEGAIVFEPEEGVFEGVAVLDMSRYYPNIALAYEVDELECRVINNLMKKRDELEKEMAKYHIKSVEYEVLKKKRNSVKYLLNATYGYWGSPRSRVYDRENAAKVTAKARLGLEVIKKASEERGYPVLYGDTDSAMIQIEANKTPKLLQHLNEVLKEHCENEGIPPLLKLKWEKYFSKVLYVKAKGEGGKAAKKRYAAHVIWDSGQKVDYIHIVGFDYVRGNTSKLTRKIQMKCFEEILKGDKKNLPSYLRSEVKKILRGEYKVGELSIPVTLRKDIDKYKSIPDYVRGVLWSNKNLGLEIVGGDRVKMIYVKRVGDGLPQTDVISYFDEERLPPIVPDYEKIIEKTVKKKVEQFLRLADITWRQVEGYADLKEVLY